MVKEIFPRKKLHKPLSTSSGEQRHAHLIFAGFFDGLEWCLGTLHGHLAVWRYFDDRLTQQWPDSTWGPHRWPEHHAQVWASGNSMATTKR
mmetsp:Transcript_18606/g.43838  ORF Transcript_18606/g.43838 Transcript_18606/m.43838 type:complete len:91 (-) Transcript_18606:9-281(-)